MNSMIKRVEVADTLAVNERMFDQIKLHALKNTMLPMVCHHHRMFFITEFLKGSRYSSQFVVIPVLNLLLLVFFCILSIRFCLFLSVFSPSRIFSCLIHLLLR